MKLLFPEVKPWLVQVLLPALQALLVHPPVTVKPHVTELVSEVTAVIFAGMATAAPAPLFPLYLLELTQVFNA